MDLIVLNFYRNAINEESPEIRSGVHEKWQDQDPFDPGKLRQMQTTEESKSLNDVTGNAIIISASGMATGGRVVHHLEVVLPDEKNTVILVGFQAAGTRGRALQEGQTQLKMYGKWIPVKAHIAEVESFSVHVDAEELTQWLSKIKKPKYAFVVHGEPDAQRSLKSRLENQLGWDVTIPKANQVFTIEK